jgi:hypothetical protein
MALRDSMAQSAQAYLNPGEQIQAVIGAQTASNWLLLAGYIPFIITNRFQMIVATPQRIVLLDTGKMSMKKARGVVAELPRSTQLGPGTGLWHPIDLNGKKVRVHRRFFSDIAAADAGRLAA